LRIGHAFLSASRLAQHSIGALHQLAVLALELGALPVVTDVLGADEQRERKRARYGG
jgi:hypothetical protein